MHTDSHPDLPTPVTRVANDPRNEPRLVILESVEGEQHEVNLNLLGRNSSFFADLSTLPTPSDDEHQCIALPSATSAGLYVALAMIAFDLSQITTWNLLSGCINALLIFDAYDFPSLGANLDRLGEERLKAEPFALYTFKALLGDENGANSASKDTLRYEIKSLSKEMDYLLQFVPSNYLDRLLQLHEKRDGQLEPLRIAMCPNNGIVDTFPSRCRIYSHWRGTWSWCTAYNQTHGDFQLLRHRISEIVIATLLEQQTYCMSKIWQLVRASAGCRRCSTVLYQGFWKALEEHGDLLFWSDTI